jgi:hypothetical protein
MLHPQNERELSPVAGSMHLPISRGQDDLPSESPVNRYSIAPPKLYARFPNDTANGHKANTFDGQSHMRYIRRPAFRLPEHVLVRVKMRLHKPAVAVDIADGLSLSIENGLRFWA